MAEHYGHLLEDFLVRATRHPPEVRPTPFAACRARAARRAQLVEGVPGGQEVLLQVAHPRWNAAEAFVGLLAGLEVADQMPAHQLEGCFGDQQVDPEVASPSL